MYETNFADFRTYCLRGVRNRPVSVSANDNFNELCAGEAFMPRRQILSSEEKERLLIVPDDDVFLTRMCFLSEHDLARYRVSQGSLPDVPFMRIGPARAGNS